MLSNVGGATPVAYTNPLHYPVYVALVVHVVHLLGTSHLRSPQRSR